MKRYNKKITSDDFFLEIDSASSRADTIFTQLGLGNKLKWFVEQHGTTETIEHLVKHCLADLKEDVENKKVSVETGLIKVEMSLDEDGFIDLGIYFNLL